MERGTSPPAQAAALVVEGFFMLGLIDNFMRLAAGTGGLRQFHVLRSGLALPLLVVLARLAEEGLRPRRPSRVLLRSLLNSLAMVIYFGCQGLMPIAQVVAPLFVVLLSVDLFGEKVGP